MQSTNYRGSQDRGHRYVYVHGSLCVGPSTNTFSHLQLKEGGMPHEDLQVATLVWFYRWLEWFTNYNRPTSTPLNVSREKVPAIPKCWDLAHLICWESRSLLQLFTRAKIWKEVRVRTKSADKCIWNDCSVWLRFCVVYYSPKTWSSYEIKSYGTDENRPVRVVLWAKLRTTQQFTF